MRGLRSRRVYATEKSLLPGVLSCPWCGVIQCCDMADWRQIQARIRKAKNSPEAPAKLSELYQRTRDAMVAWELGAVEEKAGRNDEAAKWYTIAAQRFRRSDWKKKAEEALTRLGVELPPAPTPETSAPAQISFPSADRTDAEANMGAFAVSNSEPVEARQPLALGEIADSDADAADAPESRRRPAVRPGLDRPIESAAAGVAGDVAAGARERQPRPACPRKPSPSEPNRQPIAAGRSSGTAFRAAPRGRCPDRAAGSAIALGTRGAWPSGDPALASRMAHLESMLRRLVASPLHRLDEVDEAPAGPAYSCFRTPTRSLRTTSKRARHSGSGLEISSVADGGGKRRCAGRARPRRSART